MSEQRVKYYMVRSDDEVDDLYRVIWEGDRPARGQAWVRGKWIDDDTAIRDVIDLVAVDATEAEVNAVIASGWPSA